MNILEALKYAKYLPEIIAIVASLEATFGPGTGAQKKAAALQAIAALLQLGEKATGKDLVNDEAFLALASKLIELAVGMMKLQPDLVAIANDVRDLKPPTE